MPKIRHIAYRATDVEAMTDFFVKGLGLTVAHRQPNGVINLSDGTINVTVLPMRSTRADGKPASPGIEHIGFTVEDGDEARRRLEAVGAKEATTDFTANFEVKFEGPDGIIVDLGHWVGSTPLEAAVSGTAS